MGNTALALTALRQAALLLAIRGKTAREIAAELTTDEKNVSPTTAWRYVHAALNAQRKANDKAIETYRELIAERYTHLYAKWLETAEQEPESKAGDKVLRVLEGLRQLYGLDRPVERKEDEGSGLPTTLIMTTVYVGEEDQTRPNEIAEMG